MVLTQLKHDNAGHMARFNQTRLVDALLTNRITAQNVHTLLACVQAVSNHFQEALVTCYSFTRHPILKSIAQIHLSEEIGHNHTLLADRQYEPPMWDPVIESSATWFTHQMIVQDDLLKALLMYWVLEKCANLFFMHASEKIDALIPTHFFDIHRHDQDTHAHLWEDLLTSSTLDYQHLSTNLKQAWEIIFIAADHIADITLKTPTLSLV